MKIRIRKANESDAHTIFQLSRENWKHAFKGIYSDDRIKKKSADKTAEEDKEKYRKILKAGCSFYVAETSEKPVGFIAYRRKNEIVNIGILYIDIDQHRKGIGSELMNFVERKEHAKTYTLTSTARPETLRFYEKMGYKKLRTCRKKDYPEDLDVIMIKRIK